ncbi:hypothetical protein C8J56DRAFT_885470 [Mycena floridula]|nr:hypothetical protein C8J56DRAFT_885470 [Mycena floridula]
MVDTPVSPVRPKRTASTASLPTPPRTTSRRKKSLGVSRTTRRKPEKQRQRSQWSDTEDEEEEDELPVKKKRRISEEEKVSTAEESDSTVLPRPPVDRAYASPPPSHRKPAAKSRSVSLAPSLTLKLETVAEEEGFKAPVLDAENNPFIESDDDNPFIGDDDDEENPFLDSIVSKAADPQGQFEEKPTTSWVFRGTRRTFANPLYGVPPDPKSLLPPEHPDYEPDLRCARKILFPATKQKVKRVDEAPKRKRKEKKLPDEWVDSPPPSPGSLNVNPLLMAPGAKW